MARNSGLKYILKSPKFQSIYSKSVLLKMYALPEVKIVTIAVKV